MPDHPYKILIIGDSESGKTNLLFNLISHQPDTYKIYLYVKGSFEAKFQLWINKSESTSLKHFNHSTAFNEHSNDMDNIYKSIEEYNPNKKQKTLIVLDHMNADMHSNKKKKLIQ